jgi:hypothetical protein
MSCDWNGSEVVDHVISIPAIALTLSFVSDCPFVLWADDNLSVDDSNNQCTHYRSNTNCRYYLRALLNLGGPVSHLSHWCNTSGDLVSTFSNTMPLRWLQYFLLLAN